MLIIHPFYILCMKLIILQIIILTIVVLLISVDITRLGIATSTNELKIAFLCLHRKENTITNRVMVFSFFPSASGFVC